MKPITLVATLGACFISAAFAQVRQTTPAAPPPPQSPSMQPAPTASPIPTTKVGTPTSMAAANSVAIYLEPRHLQATLKSGPAPLAGKPVTFMVGGAQAGVATTDAMGVAKVTLPGHPNVGPGDTPFTAKFAGDGVLHAAEATGKITVMKAASKIEFQAFVKLSPTPPQEKRLHVQGIARVDSKVLQGLHGIGFAEIKVSLNGILIGMIKADNTGKFMYETAAKPLGPNI